jgi:hypothetical protein
MLITEDNTKLAARIIGPKNAETYQAILSLKDSLNGDGVLACGVLHNIFVALQSLEGPVDQPVVDDSALIPTLAKAVASITGESPAPSNGAEGWSSPLQIQQLALEVLASMGTSLNSAPGESKPAEEEKKTKDEKEVPADEDMGDADADADADPEAGEDDGGEDGDEADEDDEMDEDEMQADMDMVTGADDDAKSSSMDDLPVLQALLSIALPELMRVASLQPSDQDVIQLQGLALSALNNIAWSLSVIDYEDSETAPILRAWRPVAADLWRRVVSPILAGDTADVDLATGLTGLAWALARVLRADAPLQPGEHRRFISLYQATRSGAAAAAASSSSSSNAATDIDDNQDPFQGLGVKCVGVLGQLALPPAAIDLNRDVGTFLVTIVAALPETPPADAVEALNQIFDIYADENAPHDREVYWKDNFQQHLDGALPKAKTMLKSIDKRTHPELRARADEAVVNLTRFVAYKRKHKP